MTTSLDLKTVKFSTWKVLTQIGDIWISMYPQANSSKTTYVCFV